MILLKFNFLSKTEIMKNAFYIIVVFLALTACTEQAEIKVQNLVHNASLEDINYGDYSIEYLLYPGKTSDGRVITDDAQNWPKSEQVEFYMVRDGNMVYLRTRASYTLNPDDELLIVIADTTEVISPFGKKSALADIAD